MAITGVCYSTREDVKSALDFKESARNNAQIDRALAGARNDVENLCNRKFYPQIATRVFDWPDYRRGYPWRLWLNQHEVISVSQLSSGGVIISPDQYFLEPANSGPPFSRIDLNRSTSAVWSAGSTPQHSISVAGVFGGCADTSPGGVLAAAVSDIIGTSITVSNGAVLGSGSTLLIDAERMLVTGRSMVTTGQTQQGTGCSSISDADNVLAVTDGTKYFTDEVLQLDAERLKVVDVTGNNLTVKRAWDGTVLAAHSGATVYGLRLCTVIRATLGTTAATHSNGAAVAVHRVPGIVWELAVAEACNTVLQETSGYARTVGGGDNMQAASGAGLRDLRKRCSAAAGRQVRRRVI
jgi:hypothetical protein